MSLWAVISPERGRLLPDVAQGRHGYTVPAREGNVPFPFVAQETNKCILDISAIHVSFHSPFGLDILRFLHAAYATAA